MPEKMPEKFNPKDPKYKKVEDLPKEHQGEFVNIPKAGFTRKETITVMENADAQAREINKKRREGKSPLARILDKLLKDEGEVLPLHVLHEEALSENKKKEREEMLNNTFKEIETGVARRKFDQLDSEDEKIEYASHVLSSFNTYISRQVKNRIETLMREKLKELGHEGMLFIKTCDLGNGCLNLTGVLDGKNIDAHNKIDGKIDSKTISPEEGRRLIGAYGDIAVNLMHPYGHGNMTYGSVINSAITYLSDGLSSDSFQDSDGSFNKAWAREYVDDNVMHAIKDLKKDNEKAFNNIKSIANDHNSLMEERKRRRQEQKQIAQEQEKEAEKKRREAEIQRSIGDLLPRADRKENRP